MSNNTSKKKNLETFGKDVTNYQEKDATENIKYFKTSKRKNKTKAKIKIKSELLSFTDLQETFWGREKSKERKEQKEKKECMLAGGTGRKHRV